MKFIPKISQAVAIAIALTSAVNAQSVVTEPVGFITIPAKGATGATPATTFIALSMTRPSVYQAVIPAASVVSNSTVLTFPASTFTAGQFGPAGGSFYLEILNGTSAGVTSPITATTTNSITLRDDLSNGITAGTTSFRIRPNWTFSTAFGVANETGFQGGAGDSTNADLLQLVDPLTGVATSYFYNTTSARWEKTDNSDATNVAISPEIGLQVIRKGTGDLNFKLAGAVKIGPSGLYVSGSTADTYNLLGNPYPMGSIMLKDLGLYTGNSTTGVAGQDSQTVPDVVRMFDFNHNQYNDFVYNITEGKWKTGYTDASLTVIPAGASIAVIRKAGRSSFYWTTPQPEMVLADTPLTLRLLSATIRRTHGSVAGSFGDADSNMPFGSGVTPGIDNRNGGNPRFVLKFNKSIVSGSATVQSGGLVFGSSSIVGNELIIPITSVSDKSVNEINLGIITDGDGQTLTSTSIPVSPNITAKFLIGDVNDGKSVNIGDQQIVKNNLSVPLSLGTFQADVSVSGTVNIADQQLVKNSLSNSVP